MLEQVLKQANILQFVTINYLRVKFEYYTLLMAIDTLLLIIIIVVSVLVLATTTYQMILYIHRDDKGWGKAIYCKILVVIGMTMVWVQALLLPLDVASTSISGFNSVFINAGINMEAFWSIVLFISLGLAVILLPYAIFLYETDKQEALIKRLLRAFLYSFVQLSLVAIALFVSWRFLRRTDLPITHKSLTGFSDSASLDLVAISEQITYKNISFEASIFVYSIAICSFAGWVLLIIFGGVGLFALPFDFINNFLDRPKLRSSNEMKTIMKSLNHSLESLLEQGKQLKQKNQRYDRNQEDGCCTKFSASKKLGRQFNIFKAKFNNLSQMYDIFQLELNYKNSNPLLPVAKLILGIIFLLTSIVWFFQVILGFLATFNLKFSTKLNFVNTFLVHLQTNKASSIATLLLLYISLYLVWCVQKGTINLGVQIPGLFRFHPIKQNETWMNSFLFNLILLLLASSSITQFLVLCLPSYAQTTLVYSLFGVQIRYMQFYRYFYDKMIFPIAFITWAGLSLIYQFFRCCRKPKYMREVDEIRDKYKQ